MAVATAALADRVVEGKLPEIEQIDYDGLESGDDHEEIRVEKKVVERRRVPATCPYMGEGMMQRPGPRKGSSL